MWIFTRLTGSRCRSLGIRDMFAGDLARHHAEGRLLIGDDALRELVLAQRALDVRLVRIGDVGHAVPAGTLELGNALPGIGG